MNIIIPRRRLTTTVLLLLLVIGAGCSDGDSSSSQAGSLQIAHTLDNIEPQEGDHTLFSFISGIDSAGDIVYGPLRLPYADEHTLENVPLNVVRIRIEYRLGTGRQIALADTAVDVRQNATTQVLAAASGPPNNVQVELVNDTENAGGDSNMFVLFDTPKPSGSATGIDLLTSSGSASANASGAALSSLWPKGQGNQPTLTSPYTGKVLPIYSFTVDDVNSGRLTFSYGTPASIVDGKGPTAAENYRYDKLEITYLSSNKSGGGNLTAIDFFSMPLQVEVIHWGEDTPDPLQTKSIYASTPTILKTLRKLAPNRMGPAFKNLSGGEFQFPVRDPFDLSTFARALSPNTIAAAAASGSSAPYPSFGGPHGYLESLVGKTYALNGAQYGGYEYKAKFERHTDGGYIVHCTGKTTTHPASPLPANAAVTLHLPKDQLDFFIYATVANKSSYSIAGFPFVDTKDSTAEDKVKLANASPYGAIVGDIQAALNFGYLGGRFDASTAHPKKEQDIDDYYTSVLLPYAYPYSGARVKNDGFYNPYAGVFYYLSDAYGHPYSDRLAAASPLYSLQAGDTVRITLLNDHRLDTPLVSVTGADKNKLDLAWPKVAGARGYSIELSPKPAQNPAPVGVQDKAMQTHSVTGLTPGTSYLVSVKATGSRSGQAIESAVLPVQGVTHADPAATHADSDTATSESPTFKVSLGLTPNFSSMSYVLNGEAVDFNDDASVTGVIGTNTLNLSILDADSTIVYQGTYFVTLEDASAGHFNVGAPYQLEYNLKPLTQAGPPGAPPYALGPDYPLTIGTPFAPKPYYRHFEIKFPSHQ